MILRRLLLLVLLPVSASLVAAEIGLEFPGVLVTGRQTSVHLLDGEGSAQLELKQGRDLVVTTAGDISVSHKQ